MELYRLGSLFLDISIGALLLGAIIRAILAFTYFRRNDAKVLDDRQRKTLRKTTLPVYIIGIAFGITSLILLCL